MQYKSRDYWMAIQDCFPNATFKDTLKAQNDVVACYVSEGEVQVQEHYHDYIELLYVISSEVDVNINKKEYHLKGGDFLVIIPGDVHSYVCHKDSKLITIKADTNFLFSQILTSADLHYSMPYMLSKLENARLFKAEEIDNTDVPKLVYNVTNEYLNKKPFYMLAIRGGLTTIALYVFRRWDEIKNEANSIEADLNKNGLQRLSSVLSTIETRYKDDLSVSEMAKLAGMSYSFFSRYFKATMKLTFSEYLNATRIQAAEKLLIDSDLSIAEVGEAVGFTNTSYFIAQFKKQLHITPKKYKSNFGKR